MSKSSTTIEGWIANELQVRDAQGHRVVDVSVPITPQRQVDGRWEDSGETVWYRSSFWDEHADAILDLVNKGSLVTIVGTVKVETWTKGDRSGVNIRLTHPVLSVVAARPAKNAVAPRETVPDTSNWPASPVSESDPWADETPF
jgi:single-stranded DNA-binding protein